jgi:hypothetical protein
MRFVFLITGLIYFSTLCEAQQPASPDAFSKLLDLNRIDPATFHAIAARLPKGQSPKIDGKLNDTVWQLAPAATNFYQREPLPGAASSESTEFRILYDDRRIYFGVWCFDSNPGGIRASEMKRDSGLKKGDRIAIVIDTFNDRRNGYYFATNPLGAYKDSQYTDNARITNNDWNAVWECKTSIDERGWYAEIMIPLSQLRFKKSLGDTTWGLNVARSIVRKNEETFWVPYPRGQGAFGFARLSNAGYLDGLKDLPAPRRLEFVPFVAPQIGRDYDAGISTTKADRYGFDTRIGLTQTITADLTYRTDFAQVEADQEVVNLTRFSLFFPEKRQFFTESAGLFNYGKPGVENGDQGPGLLPLFYSRRIGLNDGREIPILAGGRITGRVGPYSLGLMDIETDEADYLSGSQRVHVPRANYSIMRVKRNVFAQSSVGAIFVNREGGSGTGFNRAAGMDLNLSLGRALTITGLAARTSSPEAHGKDLAAAFDVAYTKDRYNCGFTYLDVGAGFNAEMGYIQRTDIRNSRMRGAWTPRPQWRGIRQLSFGGSAELYRDHDGLTISHSQDALFAVTFNDTSTLNVTMGRDFDHPASSFQLGSSTIAPGKYRWNTFNANYSSNVSLRVAGTAGITTGSYYNGDKTTYSAGLSLLPTERLLVEASYNHNRITLPFVLSYVTNTISTRFSYSFSPTVFAKAFFQYNDDRKLASLNLLFWCIYLPGSDLYIVYNQGWDTDVPGLQSARVKSRSLAIKLTYWLSRWLTLNTNHFDLPATM